MRGVEALAALAGFVGFLYKPDATGSAALSQALDRTFIFRFLPGRE